LAAASIPLGNREREQNLNTKPDRRNFFGMARVSIQEGVPLLELAGRQKLIQPGRHEQLTFMIF
jgi:hypothetical protein